MRKLLILTYLLGMPCISRAQGARGSWEVLSSLRAGQRIDVVETSLKKHNGTFMAVSGEAIQLREGTADETIRRENVLRVTLLEKSHRLRNIFVLGPVGSGAGAGIGAATGSSNKIGGRGVPAAVGAVVGLAGGVAIGTALPAHETVYRGEPH